MSARGLIEAFRRIRGIPAIVRAWVVLRRVERGPRVHVRGRLLVHSEGRICIGESSFFREGMVATELSCGPEAELVVGKRCGFNYGVSITAAKSVRIGEHCIFGSFSRVRDDDGLKVAPVLIGDGVWVAHGAIVEPGFTNAV